MHNNLKKLKKATAGILALLMILTCCPNTVSASEEKLEWDQSVEAADTAERVEDETETAVDGMSQETGDGTEETTEEGQTPADEMGEIEAGEDASADKTGETEKAESTSVQAAVPAKKAAENAFDIEDGKILIEGNRVTVGEGEPVTVDGDEITVYGTSAQNNITVKGDARLVIRDLQVSTKEEKSLIDLQSGDVTVRMEEKNTLSNAGGEKAVLRVSSEASLTLEGDGSLAVNNGIEDGEHEANGAGIGGNFEESPKAITVNSGTVSVTEYGTAACIGGGARADSGKIVVNGGTINVTSEPAGGDLQSAGTGIGGGGENVKDNSLIGSGGSADVTILGGTVTASARSSVFDFGSVSSGAAIGAGENKGGMIHIGGSANVTAKAWNVACAIGSSNATWGSSGNTVTPALDDPMKIQIDGSAVVKAATESLDFYGQGAYSGAAIGMSVQNLQPCTIIIGGNADVTADGSWYGAGIGGSYVQINKQAQPMKIQIKDQAKVDASAEVYGAAIGSGYGDRGAESADILIEGTPTVTADGGWGGAGIGGGKGTSGGTITITGGDITSRGGIGGQDLFGIDIGGAGIGAGAVDDSDGYGGSCEEITIQGTANVKAYGGVGSAGIGGGNLKAVTTTGDPSVKARQDNGGGADRILIEEQATVYAVGGKGASAIGTGATYEGAPEPVVEEMTISHTADIEAYADGAKYAVDLGVYKAEITNSLLNARFAENANPAGQEKKFIIEIDGRTDAELTMPADYRSFASTTSVDDEAEHTIYVKGVEECADEYAYYPDDNKTKIIRYHIRKNQMLTKDALNWITPIVLAPAEIIAYMGGDAGYDGVVNEDGQIQGHTDSLPEPGFFFTLSDELNDKLKQAEGVTEDTALDLSEHLTFKAGDKAWKLSLYGEAGASSSDGKNVYRISPAKEGQDPVRVQFTDAEGNVHINDSFTMDQAFFEEYVMAIYPGSVEQDQVMAVVDGDEYPVISQTSKLTIRGVTKDGQTEDALYEAPEAEVSVPTAVIDKDAAFTINDSNIKVVDGKIALLSDRIASVNNSEELLNAKVNEILNVDSANRHYQYTYLDLVDGQNGNMWVKSDRPVTVYLPYPEGTDAGYEFRLVHFDGLHRDMSMEDLEEQINACPVEEVEVETTKQGIRFVTDGFSPFALTWTDSYSVTYQFRSGTDGQKLPEEVMELLPTDSRKYPHGTEVAPAELSVNTVKTESGEWTFEGWDAESKMADQDITFTGTWTFEKKAVSGGGSNETAHGGKGTAAKTGDTVNVSLWLMLLAAACAGILAVSHYKKKQNNR